MADRVNLIVQLKNKDVLSYNDVYWYFDNNFLVVEVDNKTRTFFHLAEVINFTVVTP